MTSALATLYGAPDQSNTALAGNVGGQGREQEAWTPTWVIQAACRAFGGPIHLDPCGASSFASEVVHKGKANPITGGWFAQVTLVKPGTHEGLVQAPHGGTVVCLDGLTQDWSQARSVFVNPPYDSLEAWLQKCAETAVHGTPIILLGPFRPHRKWFPRLLDKAQDLVLLNYAVKFQGHLNSFPAPLFLASWNVGIPYLEERENGRWKWR